MSSEKQVKTCQNCKNEFEIDAEDFEFYEKMQVPPPTFCPECRLVRRLAWINSNTLYSRQIQNSEKKFISMYSEDKPFNIVEDKEWWKDKYDLLEYGAYYDFNKPFFEQFKELLSKAPLPHLQRNYTTMVESDYCNAASALKNCYLVFMADMDENCSYCYSVENLKDCVNLAFSNKNELCSNGIDLASCYNCHYSQNLENCNNLILCKDCVGCNDCFGSINLINKSYYIFNKPYSKEEYFKKLKIFEIGSFKNLNILKQEAEKTFLTNPHKFARGRKNENARGDYIFESKNIKDSFTVGRSENCRYSHFLKFVTTGARDCYDYTIFGVGAELVYDAAWCGLGISNIKFSFWNYGAQNLEYSFGCHSSKDLFGCVGLRNKQYCVLNKQYSKEEYEALIPKIKSQMESMPYIDSKGGMYKYGEFFPVELSPFCYNETTAQDYFPLSKEQTLAKGYKWKEREERNYNVTIKASDLPDNIKEAPDSITKEIIECENNKTQSTKTQNTNKAQNTNLENTNCATAFKIIPQELDFYRKMNLPLPRLCPNCRHSERVKQRNPLKLWTRKCNCNFPTSPLRFATAGQADVGKYRNTAKHFHGENPCPNEFETTYSPEREEIVYCDECYKQEIY